VTAMRPHHVLALLAFMVVGVTLFMGARAHPVAGLCTPNTLQSGMDIKLGTCYSGEVASSSTSHFAFTLDAATLQAATQNVGYHPTGFSLQIAVWSQRRNSSGWSGSKFSVQTPQTSRSNPQNTGFQTTIQGFETPTTEMNAVLLYQQKQPCIGQYFIHVDRTRDQDAAPCRFFLLARMVATTPTFDVSSGGSVEITGVLYPGSSTNVYVMDSWTTRAPYTINGFTFLWTPRAASLLNDTSSWVTFPQFNVEVRFHAPLLLCIFCVHSPNTVPHPSRSHCVLPACRAWWKWVVVSVLVGVDFGGVPCGGAMLLGM